MRPARGTLQPRRRTRAVPAGVAMVIMAGMLAVALPADGVVSGGTEAPGPTPQHARAAGAVTVNIDSRHPGAAVPRESLGLSFELSSASQLAQYGSRGNLVALLRSLGPGVLRLGGASADTRVAWSDRLTPKPAWASSVLEVKDLQGLRRLAAASGWRVLLTIGLAHYDQRAAAREAAAAHRVLGPWLAGIEVGNEPDSYGLHGLRALPWTAADYETEVSSYRRAIAARAPGLAVAGPGVSGSLAFIRWGAAEARRQHPALLTGHHYPLRCDAGPSIEQLLSPETRAKEAQSLARFLAVSRASSIPFRMDETNTVSCGGRPGISDTFASTLWAVSYITQTLAAGASGINLQGNPANCSGYSPLCATSPGRLVEGALHAQPEWYALLLTRQLIGDRPLRTHVVSAHGHNLTVTALRTPTGGLHVVVIDDDPAGSSAVALRLRVGRRPGGASVLALRASTVDAKAGVTLGGRTVADDGTWRQAAPSQRIAVHAGVLSVSVPASSAELITVPPQG